MKFRVKRWTGPAGRLALSPALTTALAASVLTSAAGRGADYIATTKDTPDVLSVVERAMPLDFWGFLLLGVAIAAAVCWIRRIWPGIIVAHMTIAGIYIAFGAGAMLAVAENWSAGGWRTGIGFFAAGAVHVILSRGAVREWDRVRAAP